jgi:flagellar basal-body rod protein FlgG
MEPALWIAKTGLEAQDQDMAVIANNLANVNTTGYKEGRANFEDLIYQIIKLPGTQSTANIQVPVGISMGTGVRLVSVQKSFTQGQIQNTQQPLDIAIEGRGFFNVLMPDGSLAYSRAGNLTTDSTGQLVTQNGYPIQPTITIPAQTTSITIGSDGTVSVVVAPSTQSTVLGTLQLSDFINPNGLEPIGQNLYVETSASGAPVTDNPGSSGLGILLQGSLEASNVNVVEQLVDMIQAQRAYEITAKCIQSVDQMLQYLAQTV